MQPAHARAEVGLLVVDRHDDLDVDRGRPACAGQHLGVELGYGHGPGLRARVAHARRARAGQTAIARRTSRSRGRPRSRHDREAPLVEGDSLGQQLGAQAVAVAARPVDLELHRAAADREQVRATGRPQPPALMPVDLVAQQAQAGRDEPDRAVGVGAGAPSGHRAARAANAAAGRRAGPVPERADVAGQRGQAEPARSALLGRLAGEPAGDPGQLAQRAGACRRGRAARPRRMCRQRRQSGPAESGRSAIGACHVPW